MLTLPSLHHTAQVAPACSVQHVARKIRSGSHMVRGSEGEGRLEALPPSALWLGRRAGSRAARQRTADKESQSAQAMFGSSMCILYRRWAFCHPFLRFRRTLAAIAEIPTRFPSVCGDCRRIQFQAPSCLVSYTTALSKPSRETRAQSTNPCNESDAYRERRDSSEESDPRNVWSRRSDQAYAVMVSPKLTDAQRASLTAICDAAFRDDGEEALQELLAVVPEPTDEQRQNCESAPSPAL